MFSLLTLSQLFLPSAISCYIIIIILLLVSIVLLFLVLADFFILHLLRKKTSGSYFVFSPASFTSGYFTMPTY